MHKQNGRSTQFLRHTILCGGAVFLLSWLATAAQAQVSTLEVLKRTAAAAALEEQQGHQVLFIQVDNLSRNQKSTQTYNLSGGSTYRVYAIGDDDRIADIDLALHTSTDRLIKKDDDAENVAVVQFFQVNSGQVKFTVSPYAMKGRVTDGFFSLLVVRVE